MVRKKVRARSLHFEKKKSHGKEKSKNSILTFQKNPKSKEKGKNSILTF